MEEVKVCKTCGTERPRTAEFFPLDKKNKDGLKGTCRECFNAKAREDRKNNPEKYKVRDSKNYQRQREHRKKYYKKYSKENREQIAEVQKKWREDHKGQAKVIRIRRLHRKRSLPHTLTLQEWWNVLKHFNNSCCYCGMEFDDIEPTQEHFIPVAKGGGYTKHNIICACNSCNCSKQDRDFNGWYPAQPFYDEDRAVKIIRWLSE